jgi:hypothetical protein
MLCVTRIEPYWASWHATTRCSVTGRPRNTRPIASFPPLRHSRRLIVAGAHTPIALLNGHAVVQTARLVPLSTSRPHPRYARLLLDALRFAVPQPVLAFHGATDKTSTHQRCDWGLSLPRRALTMGRSPGLASRRNDCGGLNAGRWCRQKRPRAHA